MMIHRAAPDMSEPKTLKVTLPTKIHLALHQLKILEGKTISTTVEEALVDYFRKMREAGDAPELLQADL